MAKKAKLSERILVILFMLNDDRRPNVKKLAQEFSVTRETIYRDIKALKLAGIEVETTKEGLVLKDNRIFEGLSFDELEELTMYLGMNMVEGVSSIFKHKAENIKNKLLHTSYDSTYLVKLDPYEDINMDSDDMNTLEEAINRKRKIQFTLENELVKVSPFKIINIDEFWYLLGRDVQSKKIKTYYINDLKQIKQTSLCIEEEKDIDDIIKGIQTSYFEDKEPFEVIVEVLEPIAHYFQRKKHLPSQKILEPYVDGSLKISFMVTHDEEVDNLVKSWLPHLKVLSPASLAQSIKKDLESYLKYLD